MLRMMFASQRRIVGTKSADDPQEDAQSSDEDAETLSDASFDAGVELEPWPEFMHRVTHHIEDLLERTRLEDWIVLHRRRKWHFLQRIVTTEDDRWSKRVLAWQPNGTRAVGRPCVRWSDCIEQLAGGDWLSLAEDTHLWPLSVEAYACRAGMCETFGSKHRTV